MPTSRRRWTTTKLVRPKRPTAVSATAMTAKESSTPALNRGRASGWSSVVWMGAGFTRSKSGMDLARGLAKGRDHAGEGPGGADQQVTRSHVLLPRGNVHRGPRLEEVAVPGVGDDADDRAPLATSVGPADPLADRILSGPHPLGHGLTHHDHQRRTLPIRIAEPAAPQDRHPERREVARHHGFVVEIRVARPTPRRSGLRPRSRSPTRRCRTAAWSG